MTDLVTDQSENALRQQIIDWCCALDAAQLNTGRAGNLSALFDRGGKVGMLITPSAMHYGEMSIDDIVWMPVEQSDEEPSSDGDRRPSSEWRMHQSMYDSRGRDRCQAVLHVHSSFATTLACLPSVQRDGIGPFHYMIAATGGNTIRCATYETFGTKALSAAMTRAIHGRRACLLANHGQIAVGTSIREAFDLACEVEVLCQMYWQALQIEKPAMLTDEQMADVHKQFANTNYRDQRD
jgi:L-fuculose-phosphate aldolase